MRRVVSIIVATGLLLIPFAGLGQAQQAAPPPVAQTLVREGEFALKLADRLKMGSPGSEAEAESALASAGIAPRNGWIADYPITPDIAGELQYAITQAADSGRLALSRDEALMAFQGLTAEMGLSVVVDTRGEVVQNDPPADYGQYSNPDIINNYYYMKGRPSSLTILLPGITITCTHGSLTHSGAPVSGSPDSSFSTTSTGPFTDTVGLASFPIIIATTGATGYIPLIL